MTNYVRKPEWLKVKPFSGKNYTNVKQILSACHVNTVCDEALCPNRGQCFNENTATFIIMGKVCSRHCKFCNVTSGEPTELDKRENDGIAKAVHELGLKYVVITCVTRDDLIDGGSEHFADCVIKIKAKNPDTHVEALISDFDGNQKALELVCETDCSVIGHNVETVPRLYDNVRPEADYKQSLEVLRNIKQLKPNTISKTGIMLGLGETKEEVLAVFHDLREVDCDVLTIGQYLRPSKAHYPVAEYIHPDMFDEYKRIALNLGFKYVESSPLTRSSYMAHNAYDTIINNIKSKE